MKILVTNDDGIYAPGIIALANRAAELGHDVTVVAPDRARSGAGHAITSSAILVHRQTVCSHGAFQGYDPRVTAFSCDGTPADCAIVGLVKIMRGQTDLLLSGINSGPNLGCDVFYSGTVAAAREGYFEGVRSIALSLNGEDHYESAVQAAEAIIAPENIDAILGLGAGDSRPQTVPHRAAALLNVNVPNLPPSEIKGFRAASCGRRRYRERLAETTAPDGRAVYWLHGPTADDEERPDSDVIAVNEGFIAMTFLTHDTTDYARTAVLARHQLTLRRNGGLS
ncbi:MAG: 5'/3'-nucleotidase SurE [Synergistaceae bacterium]|jgi:5'-nucleotidase|nr:5'/3'-nucleotidase SurE [Synergistaceae bacterium]